MEEEEPSQAEEKAERSAKKNEKNSFDHKKSTFSSANHPNSTDIFNGGCTRLAWHFMIVDCCCFAGVVRLFEVELAAMLCKLHIEAEKKREKKECLALLNEYILIYTNSFITRPESVRHSLMQQLCIFVLVQYSHSVSRFNSRALQAAAAADMPGQ